MTARRILAVLLTAFVLAEAKSHKSNLQKREVPSICNPTYNEAIKLQCYCVKDTKAPNDIAAADCYLTAEEVSENDPCWDDFSDLKYIHKLTFANTRGISLDYFPSNALKYTYQLQQLNIKYGNIVTVPSFAFANLSSLEEIALRDTQIQVLAVNAFAHHRDLTVINLDKNNIVEINREVFIDLPSLEKLYLTSNKLTTIHDGAFVNLNNLRELELNMNKLFSLNSETFAGLKKLQKLDLSGNSIEVVGDYTFVPLKKLQTLNLESNKIQMLDDKAFNGLAELKYLNLAHNKLTTVDNELAFQELKSLMSLSFRGNEIQELKPEVMEPILDNLHKADSSLDLEDTSFPCDCRLEWFMKLMSRTQSKNLKITLENLKCIPDDTTKNVWSKVDEPDRGNSGQNFEEEGLPNNEYEYYDGSQLDGKLFYTDVRSLINCSKAESLPTPKKGNSSPSIEARPTTLKYGNSRITTEVDQTEVTTATSAIQTSEDTFANHGLFDLSNFAETVSSKDDGKTINNSNDIKQNKKVDSYTTSRLATVSANPIDNRQAYEDNMASDEAKPDKLKAHRSVIEEYRSLQVHSSSNKNVECLLLILITIVFTFRL